MALVVSISDEDKGEKSSFSAENKLPWKLQDYLRGDANSCSSHGFRSFPRRQCCAAVKNIIENELSRNARKPLMRMRTRTISSTLHSASMAVINVVKLLPFKTSLTAAGSSLVSGETKRILPRSFSKKLFKRRFWMSKKTSSSSRTEGVMKKDSECEEIERWISSGVVNSEKYEPLDLSNEMAVTNASTTTRNSNSDGKSDCWSDITFTSDYLTTSSENDAVERSEKSPLKDAAEAEEVSERNGEDSVVPAITKNDWLNEETEKEQLSPISVMDFPDSDEGNSSPFTFRATRSKGSTESLLVKNLDKFENLADLRLKPINLEGLLLSTLMEDRSPDSSPELSIKPCSTPTFIISNETEDEDEEEEANSRVNEEEMKLERLLKTLKSEMPITNTSYNYELDIVVRDYFRENVAETDESRLLKGAEDWVNGHYDRLILGWEVKDKRQAYIRDMEEGGRWPREPTLPKEEVANQLQALILAHLVEEFLLECY